MRAVPEMPVRSPHKYMELTCPDCGDVRFYKRRHLLDGPGEAGFICNACGEAHIRRRDVSDWYVLTHDPFGKRRIEGQPAPAEAIEAMYKDPDKAIQALRDGVRLDTDNGQG